jgi:hypothetical protein
MTRVNIPCTYGKWRHTLKKRSCICVMNVTSYVHRSSIGQKVPPQAALGCLAVIILNGQRMLALWLTCITRVCACVVCFYACMYHTLKCKRWSKPEQGHMHMSTLQYLSVMDSRPSKRPESFVSTSTDRHLLRSSLCERKPETHVYEHICAMRGTCSQCSVCGHSEWVEAETMPVWMRAQLRQRTHKIHVTERCCMELKSRLCVGKCTCERVHTFTLYIEDQT